MSTGCVTRSTTGAASGAGSASAAAAGGATSMIAASVVCGTICGAVDAHPVTMASPRAAVARPRADVADMKREPRMVILRWGAVVRRFDEKVKLQLWCHRDPGGERAMKGAKCRENARATRRRV